MDVVNIMELAQLPATIIGFIMLYQMQQKMFAFMDRMLNMVDKMNDRVTHIEKAQGIWELQDERPTER